MAVSTDERYTPDSVLQAVRNVGPIGLDPCTPPTNPTGAFVFYTAADDGLRKPWRELGLVWCNPPFSRGELARWASKALDEARQGTEIVMLTPADLGTKWAQALYNGAQAVAFLHGRLAFTRPDGTYEQGAKQSSAIWYFGRRAVRFHQAFQASASVVHLTVEPLLVAR